MPAAGALVVGKKVAMQKAVAAKKAAAAKKKVDKNKLMNKKRGGGRRRKEDELPVVREKFKGDSFSPLEPYEIEGDVKKSKKNKSPLDRINSSVKNILKTLKSRRKFMLDKSRRMRVQADKDNKGSREGLLEKKKRTGNNMLKSAAAGAKGWWDKLQKFLLMTLLGSLVLAIKKNWETIKEKIDKVVNFVKDLWKFMEPVLIPLFEGLNWVVKQWSEIGAKLSGKGENKQQVEKETDQLSKDLKGLEAGKKDLDDKFKEAEKGVKDKKKQKFEDLAKEAGLGSEVSPDNDSQPEKDKEQVEAEVVEKVSGSEIETKLDDFKSKVETIESGEIKVDPEKLKQYEEGAVPVPVTGPAIVHKGEVIIPAPVVNQIGGPMNVVKFLEIGLSGGTEGSGELIESEKNKTISSAVGDFLSVDDEGSTLATLSEHLPPIMMEKMEKTLTTIKEQTDYEDPSASTVIIRVPTSAPQSGGGGGGKTIAVPVGSSPKDTLNRYVHAVIQKSLY